MTDKYLKKLINFKESFEQEIEKEIPNENIEVIFEEFGKKGTENGNIINFNIIKFIQKKRRKENIELGNINIYSWGDKKEIKTNFKSNEIKNIFKNIINNYPELF